MPTSKFAYGLTMNRRKNRWKVLREEWIKEEDKINESRKNKTLSKDSLKEIEINRQYTNDNLF